MRGSAWPWPQPQRRRGGNKRGNTLHTCMFLTGSSIPQANVILVPRFSSLSRPLRSFLGLPRSSFGTSLGTSGGGVSSIGGPWGVPCRSLCGGLHEGGIDPFVPKFAMCVSELAQCFSCDSQVPVCFQVLFLQRAGDVGRPLRHRPSSGGT